MKPIDITEFCSRSKRLIQESSYKVTLIKGALIKHDTNWEIGLVKAILVNELVPKFQSERILYDANFLLFTDCMDIEGFKTVLDNMASEKIFKLDNNSLTVGNSIYEQFSPSNDFFDWPGTLFTISGDKPQIPGDVLVGYDKPLFIGGIHAIQKWLDLHPFYGDRDGRLGCILIFFPSFKAKIRSLSHIKGNLHICTESFNFDTEKVRCNLFAKLTTGEEIQVSKNIKKSRAIIPLNGEIQEIYIYLTQPNDITLDYYFETPYRHSGKKRLLREEGAQDLENLIKSGEGGTLEFKQEVRENKTKKDLAKTAVAFANTKGGKILIGVTENAEVMGLPESELRRGEAKIKEKYQSIIRDNVKKAFPLMIEWKKMNGKIICLIDIKEGESKPYATKDNDIYIRVGATDRKPDPETELPHFFPKGLRLQRT